MIVRYNEQIRTDTDLHTVFAVWKWLVVRYLTLHDIWVVHTCHKLIETHKKYMIFCSGNGIELPSPTVTSERHFDKASVCHASHSVRYQFSQNAMGLVIYCFAGCCCRKFLLVVASFSDSVHRDTVDFSYTTQQTLIYWTIRFILHVSAEQQRTIMKKHI